MIVPLFIVSLLPAFVYQLPGAFHVNRRLPANRRQPIPVTL